MITPEQRDAIQDRIQQLIDPINNFLIADIAERIKAAGQITSTAEYKAMIARKLGVRVEEIEKEIERMLPQEEIGDLFTRAAGLTEGVIDTGSKEIMAAAISLANEELRNLTQTKTLGFVTPDGMATDLLGAYRECCDYAFTKVATGAQDFNSAVRDAVKNVAEYGVQYTPDGAVVGYESGVKTSLDAAVRRNIMDGLGLMVEQLQQKNFEDMGADGWEISAHEGSAPDHEDYQGRQYSAQAFEELNNSLVRRISTLNCKHIAFPIILGVSEPQYTDAELEAMKQRNAEGIEYEGKHYSIYEATQMQRRIERSIRLQRRRVVAYEGIDDSKATQTAQIRENILSGRYKEFSEAAGLRTQIERLETLGYNWKHKL